MKRARVILLTGVCLAAAVAVPMATAGEGEAPAAAAPAAKAEPPAEPPAALVADPGTAAAEEGPPASPATAVLELPDGTSVPTLNGAVGAAPLSKAWSPGIPYSPIVRTERTSAGVEWYVHADGTRSTTEMKWREDLGRMDALTRVAHPGPTPPAIRQ